MTERSDIHAEFNRSPRVIVIEADSTELTMQDLVDTLKGVIEQSWNGIDEPALHSSAGKEQLGGETEVGITVTLQDAQVAFEARNIPISTGTATSADTGTLLTDTLADFVTDGVVLGDTIINFDDHSLATVVEIVSPTVLRHYQLTAGINNDWGIGDFYHVQHVAQCNITGGNLVALDDLEQELSPISPTAFTQIVKTASSSATLQELAAIQYASFNGGVTVDVVNGVVGTDFPIGTSQEPVNNFTDANAIALERGFNTFYIKGNATCSGHNIDSKIIVGENPLLTTLTVSGGCSTNGTEFRDCKITGTLSGSSDFRNCVINTIADFQGTAYDCGLTGNISLGGTSSDLAQFINCYLGTGYVGLVEVGMNGDGPHLAMRGYSGGVRIVNKSGASKVVIDFLSGRVEIMDTVSAGTFFIRGVGEITVNQATGITLNDDSLINPAIVSDAVWDETLSDHQLTNSFGAGIARNLGLTQENQYIDQNVYTEGKLTSARIRIYSDPASVGTDSDVLATYTTTATYTGDEMTTYKVVKE